MRYSITVKRKRIYVNGKITKPIDASSGGYRLIGLINGGEFVVKADMNDDEGQYTGQTLSELLMLKHIVKRDRQYFPEVVATGTYTNNGKNFCWLIERYYEFDDDPYIDTKIENTMYRLMDRYDLEDIGMPLSYYGNWAIVQGKPLIYDFGINRYGLLDNESMYDVNWPASLAKR